MSVLENTISLHSLMDAITYHHNFNFNEELILTLLPFMRELIDHLIELSLTQSSIENIERTLLPYLDRIQEPSNNYKSCMEDFFIDFVRLLQSQTNRIKRHGQRKFKYLVETVSKQIFNQILRLACDLKVENATKGNENILQTRKHSGCTLLSSTVSRFLCEPQLKQAFHTLKNFIRKERKQEEKFVDRVQEKIQALDSMLIKKRKIALNQTMYSWRQSTIMVSKLLEEDLVYKCKNFIHSLLPELIGSWEEESSDWLCKTGEYLRNMFEETSSTLQNINICFVLNPDIEGEQSLQYSTSRRNESKDEEMFRECMKKGQIVYCKNNQSIIVPICLQEPLGVVVVQWKHHLPMCFFDLLIKTIDHIKRMLEEVVKLGTRISYYSTEIEENGWQLDLFNQHLLATSHSSPIEVEPLLTKLNIQLLQIYHEANPCIVLGDEPTKLPSDIVSLIFKQVEEKSIFQLNRGNVNNLIVRIDEQNEVGFCRIVSYDEEFPLEKGQMIKKCLIPLLIKSYGCLECSRCNFNIKEVPIADTYSENETKVIETEKLIKLKHGNSIEEIEEEVLHMIGSTFNPVFGLFLYKLSDSSYIYLSESLAQCIHVPKQLILNNVYQYISQYERQSEWNEVINALKGKPLFPHSELYLYEKEKAHPIKIVSQKVGKKGLIVVGSYELVNEDEMFRYIDRICTVIDENQKLFERKDMLLWGSTVIERNSDMQIPSLLLSKCDEKVDNTSFEETFKKINYQIGLQSRFYLWKINKGKVHIISGQTNSENILPYHLMVDSPLQSHQQHVQGSHCTVRRSKRFGSKLQPKYSFVPSFGSPSIQLKYAEALMGEENRAVGDVTESNSTSITEYLEKGGIYSPKQEAFISVPVEFEGKTYLILVVYKRNKVISFENFQALSNCYSQILQSVLKSKKSRMKNQSLNAFHSLLLPVYEQKERRKTNTVIQKFSSLRNSLNDRANTFGNVCKKIRNVGINRQLNFAFSRLSKNSSLIRSAYMSNTELLLCRIMRVYGMNKLMEKLRKAQWKRKGAQKIGSKLHQMVQRKICGISHSFCEIKESVQMGIQIKKTNKIKAVKGMANIVKKIYQKKISSFFALSIKTKISLIQGIRLISEEFELQNINSIPSALTYLKKRLHILLQQYLVNLPEIQFKYQQNKPTEEDDQYTISKFTVKCPSHIFPLLKDGLEEALQNWMKQFVKKQRILAGILLNKLKNIYFKNMKGIYEINKKYVNQENIKNLSNIRKQCLNEEKTMMQLEEIIEKKKESEEKQAFMHKNKIRAMKDHTITLQNDCQEISVSSNIKSKTNAAYKMMAFLTKNRAEKAKKHTQQFKEDAKLLRNEIKLMREENRKQMPRSVWSIKSILEQATARRSRTAFSQIQSVRLR